MTPTSPEDFRALVAGMLAEGDLTQRQADVLRLRAGGMSWRNVGLVLGVSERTVREHHDRAVEKLRKGTCRG